MDNQLQQALNAMQQQLRESMQQQQAQLQQQQQQLQQQIQQQQLQHAMELQRLRKDQRDKPDRQDRRIALTDEVAAAVSPHLQCKPLEPAERRSLLSEYPKPDQLPAPITDANGLASKTLSDTAQRKLALTILPQLQRDALDVGRVAAAAWEHSLSLADSDDKAEYLLQAIQDILGLSIDNAQRMAKTQLELTFDSVGAKGAYSLLNLEPNTQDIDFRDPSLLQQAHVDCIKDIRSFNGSLEAAKKAANARNVGQKDNRGGNRNDNGRGRGRNRYRGGRDSKNWRRDRGNNNNNYFRAQPSNNNNKD